MTVTQPSGPQGTGAAAKQVHARRGTPAQYLALLTAVGAVVLTTIALVLWLPIDQAAIERADDAGWDTSLLLPHQSLLTLVLLGACLCSWLTAVVNVICLRSRAPRS